jgi:hypothetical protein
MTNENQHASEEISGTEVDIQLFFETVAHDFEYMYAKPGFEDVGEAWLWPNAGDDDDEQTMTSDSELNNFAYHVH